MRSRSVWSMSTASLMGLGVGLAAGVAAGLLAAPMRGADMRRSLKSRADGAVDRGMHLLEEGRRAFRTRGASESATLSMPALTENPSASTNRSSTLSASLGEIAQMHSGADLSGEGRS